MTYLETVNHVKFGAASLLVHSAERALKDMGMTRREAQNWITAWTSGASDPEGDDVEYDEKGWLK